MGAGVVTLGLCVSACSTSPDGASDSLATRVEAVLASDAETIVDRLQQLGVEVDAAAVGEAAVDCPTVDDPEPDDRATCTADIAGAEVAIDVEFGDDDSIRVVDLSVVP